MDKPQLLIADSSEIYRRDLSKALECRYQVQCCRTGTEALDQLRSLRPALLVLDLTLPELDGISVLRCAAEEGIRPRILVASSLASPYVLSSLQELGVSYLVMKPCHIPSLARRVTELAGSEPVNRQSENLGGHLLSLGLAPRHRGFHYLRSAAAAMAGDPGQSVTKVLYPQVAAQFGVKPAQVERSIRSALSTAWEHGDKDVWHQYFPGASHRCPSNAVFIARIAELLR